MKIGESMLPEFDQEMAGTRRVLENLPEDKLDWKAHEKSNSIGWVANHLADIPKWTNMTLTTDALDVNPPDGKKYQTPALRSRAEILDLFDKNVAEARAALATVEDAELFKDWALLNAGKEVMRMPKLVVIRSFVLNHSIHHRAHLCVYYRLNDVPVPGLYGPSADDTGGL